MAERLEQLASLACASLPLPMADMPRSRSISWRVHMPVLQICSLCRLSYDRASMKHRAVVLCDSDGCPQVHIGFFCKFCAPSLNP